MTTQNRQAVSLLPLLLTCASVFMATPAKSQSQVQPAASPAQAGAAPAPAAAPPAPVAPALPEQAPPPEAEAAPAVVPGEPLYSLDIHHQNADDVISEFAKETHISLILLDRAPTLINIHFENLPLASALREILQAADMDFVKTADGYVAGLPIDLKLRFPSPNDKFIQATYRCRRVGSETLVKTIREIFGTEAEFRVATGPEFLTPPLEEANAVGGDTGGGKVLKTSEPEHRTHDVVFSGPPDLVRRALSLARKFDRPRKQVRVSVRVMHITSTASRNLGVAWMPSLSYTANEVPSASASSSSSSSTSQAGGITIGKFTHTPISVNATLNALEQAGEAKTLANPTLMVLDGEKSFILSGTKYILPKISIQASTGQAQYDTMEVKLGLYLQVGVQVGLDDDMVLTIYPQVSTLQGYTTINTIEYPIISSIEEQATVRAVKGDVIALGGLKDTVSSDSRSGVPFLSKLPIIGKLFSNDDKEKNDEELMFVLTPEIVEDQPTPLDMNLKVTPAPAQAGS